TNPAHQPAQHQPDPRTAKRPLPFYRNALQINFYPLRFDVPEQSALKQRPHLRLVGECPDALPHPSHRGRPPRAAAVPATSDSFRPEPSSHDACHPSCDSNDVSTCVDPTSLHFTFKSVGLHYKRLHRPPRTRIRDAHCKHEC